MKKAIYFVVALAALFASCGGDDDDITGGETPSIPQAKGTAQATIDGKNVNVNWVQLWENGPKFAEYNVGATSVADYGGYYCWGSNKNRDIKFSYKKGDEVLKGDDDTATKLWGSKWRMPTEAELEALCQKCDAKWTSDYKGDKSNISGKIFTGKGAYSSFSVFFPAAGRGDTFRNFEIINPDALVDIIGEGGFGFYWTSTPNTDKFAHYIDLHESFESVQASYRDTHYSVRAVLAE